MSSSTPLFETIEADEPAEYEQRTSAQGTINPPPTTNSGSNASRPAQQMATNPGDAESGIAGILRQSAHPLVLFFLYFFRVAAITVYILCGFFISNYVLSSVIVVVLLAMDFWNCRNVAGRRLVGLRYWNQVDDDGSSYWVFESRDPSRPANPIDSKMFWIAVYTFPLLWLALLIVSVLKFNLSFVPIVVLALVFNVTNGIGFTYADRDAKAKWANNLASSGWNMGMGGLGGQILTGVVKNSVGRVFG
ncbi:Golgi apparatus membrane protein TVP23 [Trametes pubescens]|uniref:Golgi apparatus membrane protein TVP23 n=1 Tax=Trametes pubescens TaxID=154538 RepID=A0A1M2VH86_TRAPU|nr:Golgi apparatus membrane protein TVP23 [Trametes pubescens]